MKPSNKKCHSTSASAKTRTSGAYKELWPLGFFIPFFSPPMSFELSEDLLAAPESDTEDIPLDAFEQARSHWYLAIVALHALPVDMKHDMVFAYFTDAKHLEEIRRSPATGFDDLADCVWTTGLEKFFWKTSREAIFACNTALGLPASDNHQVISRRLLDYATEHGIPEFLLRVSSHLRDLRYDHRITDINMIRGAEMKILEYGLDKFFQGETFTIAKLKARCAELKLVPEKTTRNGLAAAMTRYCLGHVPSDTWEKVVPESMQFPEATATASESASTASLVDEEYPSGDSVVAESLDSMDYEEEQEMIYDADIIEQEHEVEDGDFVPNEEEDWDEPMESEYTPPPPVLFPERTCTQCQATFQPTTSYMRRLCKPCYANRPVPLATCIKCQSSFQPARYVAPCRAKCSSCKHQKRSVSVPVV
jgi:hypothetical protein